jgi:hypothetical protein
VEGQRATWERLRDAQPRGGHTLKPNHSTLTQPQNPDDAAVSHP